MSCQCSGGLQSQDPRFSDVSSAFVSMAENEDLKSERSAFMLQSTEHDEPKTHDKEAQVDPADHAALDEAAAPFHQRQTSTHHDEDETRQQEEEAEAALPQNPSLQGDQANSDEKPVEIIPLRKTSPGSEILTQPDTHRSHCPRNSSAHHDDQKQDTATDEDTLRKDLNSSAKRKKRPARAALRRLSRTMSRTSDSVRSVRRILGKKGDEVQNLWNFILRQAMGISSLFGLLSLLFLSMAVVSSSWRHHEFKFEDRNGNNTISVYCGLDSVRRVHQLKRFNETGTLYLLDKPKKYTELIDSPYCQEEPDATEESAESAPSSKKGEDAATEIIEENEERDSQASSRRLSEVEDAEALAREQLRGIAGRVARDADDSLPREREESAEEDFPRQATEDGSLDNPSSSEDMAAGTGTEPSSTSSEANESRRKVEEKPSGILADLALAPFQVIFGRDPAASGSMTEDLARVRRTLLGPAVYELNCRYLPDLKRAGEALWSMIIPAFVFSALGLLCGWLCTSWGRYLTSGLVPPTFALKLLGSVSWIVSLALLVAGLGAWGTISDVAACVSAPGGSTVCKLGISSAVAVTALALNLLATTWFAVHFTDRHITALNLATSDDLHENSQSNEKELGILQADDPDLEAGRKDARRHSSDGSNIPKIFVGNAEEVPSSGAADSHHEQRGHSNPLRNLIRHIVQLATTLLLTLLPPAMVAISPPALRPAAPQAAAIIASSISEVVSELAEKI
ncbi:hypothetical protein BESB_007310 [Besnoitia besnoiti]|uniref:Transmembrane protein n=1 Tax=Besnoitia besnoiti TaxID=94643 RepID=A0A2A9MKD3_BESBE|nr:hypothetical protein BESB_007310 [Besnoitia besnoiti]PFH38389.1 hypothetical protein BESB_007310 [Besnoitia besnoiti]